MTINFYDDPDDRPVMREEVRLRDVQIEVSPEGRRVAVDFELTPFIERPSLQVQITNAKGEKASTLTVIDTLNHQFGLVMHLRDQAPTKEYKLQVIVYYASLEDGQRQVVHRFQRSFAIR